MGFETEMLALGDQKRAGSVVGGRMCEIAHAGLHNVDGGMEGARSGRARGAGRSMRARGESVERRESDMAARPHRAAAPRPWPRE